LSIEASSGVGWYGRYMRLHGHGCLLCFNASTWSKYGQGPFWLNVTDTHWHYSEHMENTVVSHLGRERCIPSWEDGWVGLWVPILLPLGLEIEATVRGVVEQVREVAEVLQVLETEGAVISTPRDKR
jgi:hypothetical protein